MASVSFNLVCLLFPVLLLFSLHDGVCGLRGKPVRNERAEFADWLTTTHFQNVGRCKPLQSPPFDPATAKTFHRAPTEFSDVPMCQPPTPLPYDHYHFPNAFGQSKIQQVLEALYLWWPIVSSQCSAYLPSLLCSMYMPACFPLMPNKGEQPNILPCRETCESVRQSCDDVVVRQANLTWPWWLDCSLFPPKRLRPSDKSVCIDFTDEENIKLELAAIHKIRQRDNARTDAKARQSWTTRLFKSAGDLFSSSGTAILR